MTHRQDDNRAPAGGADILPFRRPATPVETPVPVPAPHSDDEGDDDGPSAA